MTRQASAWVRLVMVRYGVEALILALLALTVAAVAFQGRLLTRTIAFTPTEHPTAAVYSDGDVGGASRIALNRARPLEWDCMLRRKFAYRYCGYELLTDPKGWAKGVDISKYDDVTIRLGFEGPSDELSLFLKNHDPRYSKPGFSTTTKFNRLDFRAARGELEMTLRLKDARVADWWLAAHPVAPALAAPQFDDIVSFAIQTGDHAKPGLYRFRLRGIIPAPYPDHGRSILSRPACFLGGGLPALPVCPGSRPEAGLGAKAGRAPAGRSGATREQCARLRHARIRFPRSSGRAIPGGAAPMSARNGANLPGARIATASAIAGAR